MRIQIADETGIWAVARRTWLRLTFVQGDRALALIDLVLAPMGVQLTEDEITAAIKIAQGYRSVSNKYRTLAKLPDGLSPWQALRAAGCNMGQASKWDLHGARSHYLRVYSKDTCELTTPEFIAFKKLGGPSA